MSSKVLKLIWTHRMTANDIRSNECFDVSTGNDCEEQVVVQMQQLLQPEQRRLHLDRIRQTFLPSSVCSVTTSVLVFVRRVFRIGGSIQTNGRHAQTNEETNIQ